MTRKLSNDPRIDIKYRNGTEDVWITNATIRIIEAIADKITVIDFREFWFHIDDDFKKALEEMIHACLPDPEASLGSNVKGRTKEENKWKKYLYKLLIEECNKNG